MKTKFYFNALLALIITLPYLAIGQVNSLTTMEVKQGWKLLFDGKSTKGWHNYGKSTISPNWVVQDSSLHLTNGHGNDIVSDETYENFELQLEWKISQNGNSGIFYLVNEDTSKYKAIWHTAPEYQILDNDGHPDRKYENHRAGSNYDLITPEAYPIKPVGEFNKTVLVVKKGKVEHWLNGVKVVEYQLWTPEWEELVAKSKFKNRPGYGRSKVGHIGLQDHGDKVWFRSIKIRKL
jgi:hypothetical protein